MRLSSPTAWTRDLIEPLGLDRRLRCGIVREVTEWPVTIDRRYHDAVILDLDSVVTKPENGRAQAFESAVPLLRRLRDGGVATAVYSSTRDCAETLRVAGISELVSISVDESETAGEPNLSVLVEAATRIGISPGRCVIIACDEAAVRSGLNHWAPSDSHSYTVASVFTFGSADEPGN
jgi:phosphoglycolate phosphatase-like HAD superfamily hydrolase